MTTIERNYLDVSSDITASGVSWASIFAGAAAAAALSLILLILGVGLGLPAISPWSHNSAGATAIGLASILWLTFSQIAASGLGGYLSGRLRIRWATVHTDEVYFRDTAHGFLAWAIASLATAALLGAVVGNVVSIGVSASAAFASNATGMAGIGGAASANHALPPMPTSATGYGGPGNSMLGYRIDSLFRSEKPPADIIGKNNEAAWLEAERIFANGIRANSLPAEDRQYLAHIVAQRTGLSPADAEKRVSDVFNKAHAAEQNLWQTAETARKAAAYAALWMFVALLSGAFVASLAATYGGRQRDRVIHISAADPFN